MTRVDFTKYDEGTYQQGRGLLKNTLWWYTSVIFFESGLFPFFGFKNWLLRKFGATIGDHVKIKPNVRIKFPWHLEIGDHVWIGQNVWLDTIATLKIGSHVLISQGAYIVCGSHDWNDPGMYGFPQPVVIEDGVWICAGAKVAAGSTVREESIVLLGAVLAGETEPGGIYHGVPAVKVGERKIKEHTRAELKRMREAEQAEPQAVAS